MALFCLIPGNPTTGDRIYSILHREGKGLTHETRSEIVTSVLSLSREYDMNPMLIVAIMKVESHFNLRARSQVGAKGLMQVMPIVVKEISGEMRLPESHRDALYHATFNLRVGVHYLANLIERFDGDLTKALIAYNRGPTAVARNYRNRPIPLNGYARKVLSAYRDYLGS